LVGAVLAVCVPVGAIAAGQAPSVTLSDTRPNKGTTITIDFYGSSNQGSAQQSPSTVLLRAARGFRLDRRAVADLCDPPQAQKNSCPAASRIGGGTADVTASGALLPPTHLTAKIDLYLAPPAKRGDLAAIVAHFKEPKTRAEGSSTARVYRESAGPFGLDTRFDIQGAYKPPQGITVHLDRLHVSVGAHRTIRVKVKQKKHHGKKSKPKTKRVTVNLFTTPPTCGGSWPWEVRAIYPDGHESAMDGSVACTRPG
jgi:hypothetical protein